MTGSRKTWVFFKYRKKKLYHSVPKHIKTLTRVESQGSPRSISKRPIGSRIRYLFSVNKRSSLPLSLSLSLLILISTRFSLEDAVLAGISAEVVEACPPSQSHSQRRNSKPVLTRRRTKGALGQTYSTMKMEINMTDTNNRDRQATWEISYDS